MLGAGIYALVGEAGGRVGGAIWAAFSLAVMTTKQADIFLRAAILLALGVALFPQPRADRAGRSRPRSGKCFAADSSHPRGVR
jgi:hypothetical protein